MLKSKIKIASERVEAKVIVGDNLHTDFHLLFKGRPNLLHPDLWQKISDMLIFNDDPERRWIIFIMGKIFFHLECTD